MAAIAAAGIAAVGAIGSGIMGGKSAKKAAKAQLKGVRESNALQRYLYEQSRSDLAPYRQTGYSALNQMNRVMGLPQVNTNPTQYSYNGRQGVYQQGPGGYGSFGANSPIPPETLAALQRYGIEIPGTGNTYDNATGAPVEDRYGGFEASPGYQFAYDNAMQGAERAASAGGYLPTANGGASGRFSKEMARYSQGLASQEFGNYFNRLGVLSGVGETATNNGIIAGQNYGTNAGNAILSGADARASGIIGKNNAWQAGIEGVTSAFGDYLRSRQQPSATYTANSAAFTQAGRDAAPGRYVRASGT